ncbi:hypothetical protein DACRYDRAFT_118847 [Dacryopinax primogenitus]|uniref:Camp independent regulatory protein n=1 Tax=Dacryopinax primogenitus (strain DJM 731) TaxID=1858805 RepID=M5FSC2_DACPD|nr:uncharacterized protein DACRYDRAFT_118847 [Dacryopinax primogenitus]EJT98074.1 hypothetical protein DACRYDRAFT_118847 [Dacryopinax primogenitus]
MPSQTPAQSDGTDLRSYGPYSGWIDTTYDALLVYEAASRGIIPRITRRLSANERALIGSGTIFVYDERESGIKRWTDGYTWSPSRALNNFFLYREVLSRSPNSPTKSKASTPKDDSGPEPIDEQCCYSDEVRNSFEQDRILEKALVGSLRSSYPFKVGGLIKKTISFCVKGVVSHHIVSYYTLEDIINGRLIRVSDIPEVRRLQPSSIYMDNLDVLNFPPKTMKTEEGVIRYIAEADDIDKSRAGRPKDHPHIRAEERAREHNFGFEGDQEDASRLPPLLPTPYPRYHPYFRRQSDSSAPSPEDDEQGSEVSPYYYSRGAGPSRRPGGQAKGYSNYPYPYDPYTYHRQWHQQYAAPYYAPYPPVPYPYPYPYPPYYSDSRYGRKEHMQSRSPGRSSVERVERDTRSVAEKGLEPKRKRGVPLGSDSPTTVHAVEIANISDGTSNNLSSSIVRPPRSMSPLTPPVVDDGV